METAPKLVHVHQARPARTAAERQNLDSAEDFARTVRLPMMVCPVTKELYGYAVPILDREEAKRLIRKAFGSASERMSAHALYCMEERVEALRAK